jgi:diguanylate cyclase (GGDEF)-like protein
MKIEIGVLVGRLCGSRFSTASHNAKRSRAWLTTASLVVAAGSIGSIATGQAISSQRVASSLRQSTALSIQIAETLKLALQHEDDLVAAAQSFELDAPNAPQPEFMRWSHNVGALARYPELFAIGVIQVVPRAELSSFATHFPIPSMTQLGSSLSVVPPGTRPYYCLARNLLLRYSTLHLPRGLDVCRAIPGVILQNTQFSGRTDIAPVTFLGLNLLSVSVPLYRGGSVPATVSQRKRDFIGYIGVLLDPSVVISSALVGHPGIEVGIRYDGPTGDVQFQGGSAPRNGQVRLVNLRDGWTVVTRMRAPSGNLLNDGVSLAALLGGLVISVLIGGILYLLGAGRSRAIHAFQERTKELQFLAYHDSLTGLPNRAQFLDRLEIELARHERGESILAVLFLDLDEFKVVNDSLGHSVGDDVLTEIGRRFRLTVRRDETVARFSGDEFAFILSNVKGEADAVDAANRVLKVLEPKIVTSETELTISASVGIVIPGPGASPTTILRDADAAMYQAKEDGRNRYALFDQRFRDRSVARLSMEGDLRRAIDRQEFELYYQPMVIPSSGRPFGAEALIRWHHPDRGLVAPLDFIPIAESSRLIRPIGRWVIEQAAEQLAKWDATANGPRLEVLSINLSSIQLEDEATLGIVTRALDRFSLDPGRLCIEVTESAVMADHAQTRTTLEEFRSLGLCVSIDDFGTGYSSLAYLHSLPATTVKVDRSFVERLGGTADSMAVVRAIVEMSHALGLRVVAEGVSSVEAGTAVVELGCDVAQGFLWARPMPVPQFDEWWIEAETQTELRMRRDAYELSRSLTSSSRSS